MKGMIKALVLPVMALTLTGIPAVSQDHHDNGTYQEHKDWKPGHKLSSDDWNRGDKVDYKAHHLRKPAEGHEWRKIDGHYIMADQDGKIAVVRPAPHNHQQSPDHPQ